MTFDDLTVFFFYANIIPDMVKKIMEKKKRFLTLVREWGFDPSWGTKLLKKHPEIVEKGYITVIQKGRGNFYYVEDEEGFKEYLKQLGYHFSKEE